MAPDWSLLEKFRKDLYHCSDCNYCVDAVWAERGIAQVCATVEHHAPVVSYSGRGFLLAARALLEGQALSPATLAERVFSCTGCGNCEAVCPLGLAPTHVGDALREALAAADELPAPVAQLRRRMHEQGNAWGYPADARAQWATGLSFASANEATVHYAPGCAVAFGRPAEARAAMAILQVAGERVHFDSAKDGCCGAPLREAGLQQDAERVSPALANVAPGLPVVGSSLECLPSWHKARGAAGARSFAQWLQRALQDGGLRATRKASAPAQVHVFDSCAGRRLDASPDLTREVLATLGQRVCNPAETARFVVCCGAAGTLGATHADAALRAGAARVAALGEEVLVAGDVRCLSQVATAGGLGGEQTFGLAEFISRHFELQGVR